MESQIESIDNNNDNSNSNSSNTTEDKTYHFRKGSDLDGFESFGSLFADGLFTDLAICCSGRVFRCHRVIMAASSLYMKNALSAFNNTNNNNNNINSNNNCNTIMIMPENIKVSDMEAILHFIYNGQVEVTRDAIESFLTSAKTLNIKGLANIKLVYNNQNQNNENKNHNNHNINNNNHINSNSNSNNSNNNNTINSNNDNIKRRNGIIATNRSQLKNDLNFSGFNAISQTQSFHSSQEIDLNNGQSNRRKQRFPSNTPINGFTNDSTNEDSQWITITDEEEGEDNDNDNGMDEKAIEKMEDMEETNGEELSQESVPQMPCLIQIDADPTTFPSYCPETTDNGIKRRRSSSLKSLADVKTQKSGNTSVKTNRNNDQIRKPMKIVRSSNRKLGFISFHKSSSTSIWNSNNKWKCDICNKLYGNKQTLKEHIDYFHSNRAEQIFTCNICSKEYTWKKSLMKHYRDIHQISNNSLMEISKQTDSMVTSVNSSQNK